MNARRQAAVIAYRLGGNGALKVCLIRRKDSNRWGIPKGVIEPGDTLEETALNEAWEEAGLKGRLIGESIGDYKYKKWGGVFTVSVFLMEVLQQDDDWEESKVRERKWTTLSEAEELLASHPAAALLDRVKRRLR